MAAGRIKFNEHFERQIWAAMDRRIAKGAEIIKRNIKKNIGVQGPPRSTPGEPPHVDTAALIKSIFTERMEQGVYMIGSDVPHSITLEVGTIRVAPRPFWRRSLMESQREVVRAVLHPPEINL